MIEIEEKYKIERKKPDLRYFRLIFFTLYTKEIKRAFNVYVQTLISPLVQVSIFLIIFNKARFS